MTNKIIIVLGTPGAGKNIIAEHVAHCLCMQHVNYRSVMINADITMNDRKARQLRGSKDPFPAKDAIKYLKDYLQKNSIRTPSRLDRSDMRVFPKLKDHTVKNVSRHQYSTS